MTFPEHYNPYTNSNIRRVEKSVLKEGKQLDKIDVEMKSNLFKNSKKGRISQSLFTVGQGEW
jgi:hypothetical protein